ncbi:unnamed protein product [Bursaphelenchus xylophilus]|uniref:(pine wood nematode) hypothetical protein n=1 Tax=Bursaphelenchus xylophilus TaxID=6326 RepID=A0A1I7S5W7_BURXY|nr:unnamed protein product [Bursaphelenchus xylophilus]CAG9082602.1 unnamed protein product [Bursaphelenchus xylophilus]
MHRAFPEDSPDLDGSLASLKLEDDQEKDDPVLNKTYTKKNGERMSEAYEYLELLNYPFEHWFLDHEHSESEIKKNSAKFDSSILIHRDKQPEQRDLNNSFSTDDSTISDDVFMPEIYRKKKLSAYDEPPTRRSSADAAEEVLRRLKSYQTSRTPYESHYNHGHEIEDEVFYREDELDRLLRSELGYMRRNEPIRDVRHHAHSHRHQKRRGHRHRKDEIEEIRKGIRDCRVEYKKSKNLAVETLKKAIDERQKSRASSVASFHSRPASGLLLRPNKHRKSVDLIPLMKL